MTFYVVHFFQLHHNKNELNDLRYSIFTCFILTSFIIPREQLMTRSLLVIFPISLFIVFFVYLLHEFLVIYFGPEIHDWDRIFPSDVGQRLKRAG